MSVLSLPLLLASTDPFTTLSQHFDFGTSLTLRRTVLYNLLHATLSTLSSSQPLFLIFHDPRADLRSLSNLGFDRDMFEEFNKSREASAGVFICDTQSLYSGWAGVRKQTRLETCCEALEVSRCDR